MELYLNSFIKQNEQKVSFAEAFYTLLLTTSITKTDSSA